MRRARGIHQVPSASRTHNTTPFSRKRWPPRLAFWLAYVDDGPGHPAPWGRLPVASVTAEEHVRLDMRFLRLRGQLPELAQVTHPRTSRTSGRASPPRGSGMAPHFLSHLVAGSGSAALSGLPAGSARGSCSNGGGGSHGGGVTRGVCGCLVAGGLGGEEGAPVGVNVVEGGVMVGVVRWYSLNAGGDALHRPDGGLLPVGVLLPHLWQVVPFALPFAPRALASPTLTVASLSIAPVSMSLPLPWCLSPLPAVRPLPSLSFTAREGLLSALAPPSPPQAARHARKGMRTTGHIAGGNTTHSGVTSSDQSPHPRFRFALDARSTTMV